MSWPATRAIVYLAAVAASGCTRAAPAPATPTAADLGPRVLELTTEGVANSEVRTVQLQPQTFAPRLRTTATIGGDPNSVARLGSRVPGRVAKIDVTIGALVKKGQALIEIDAVETHQVALEYATAKARAKAANDALARQRQLVAERVGAEQDLRRAEAEAATTGAALHEAEEHLRFLGLTVGDIAKSGTPGQRVARAIVRAPIEGRVATLDVALGQVLEGSENVITILQLDRLWVELRVYERDLARVVRGRPVEFRVPAFPEQTFRGTLTFVGDLIDPVSRTVQARAAIDTPGPLRPGMTATALVELRADPATLWLPVDAIQKDGTDAIVFVRVGERRFSPRRVTHGLEEGGFVPVRSGLTAGADVVVHGALALRGELERAVLED